MSIAVAGLALVLLAGADRTPTVAISYFDNNSGRADLDRVAKGLADMLINDLVGLEGIRVVERPKLNVVLAELDLSQTRFIDPATALKLGRGLAARYLITGSYTLAGESLRLDARVLEVETGAVLAGESVGGRLEDFFRLEQELAKRLIPALRGATRGAAPRRPAGTTSFDAWMQYATSLDAEDRGDIARAQKLIEQALRLDPNYAAAKNARERLAILFARRGEATLSAADEALAGLAPNAPEFPQKVEDLLQSLDETKSDQLGRKVKVLRWLGERRLIACPRREGPALGNPTVFSGAVPMGGVASHCQQAGEVLKIAYRLVEDPTQRDVIPRVCEYFIHELPGDGALLQYCERGLVGRLAAPGRPEKESERKKRNAEAARLPKTDWRRALYDNDDAMKALLAVYANNPAPQ
jgi:TolB-like protein